MDRLVQLRVRTGSVDACRSQGWHFIAHRWEGPYPNARHRVAVPADCRIARAGSRGDSGELGRYLGGRLGTGSRCASYRCVDAASPCRSWPAEVDERIQHRTGQTRRGCRAGVARAPRLRRSPSVPARSPDTGPTARARLCPHRERERHRGKRRDSLRRQ